MGSAPLRLSEADQRLHSWKEIASFLGRAVRTVQRWEMERGLPVHRAPGGKTGSVYALKSELAAWLASGGDRDIEPSASQGSANDPAPLVHDQSAADQPASQELVSTNAQSAHEGEPLPSVVLLPAAHRTNRKPWLAGGAIAAVLAVAAVLFFVTRHLDRPVFGARHTPSSAAVGLYLRGRYYWEKRTPEDLDRAIDLFTQAIVEDPAYAQPYAGMADCYNLLRQFSTMPEDEAYPRAFAAAKRAVQLDDRSAEAHTSLAFVILYWKWDWPTAEREFQRAIELKPDSVTAHHWYANALMSRGRFADALQEIDIAGWLDPRSTAILGSKGLILMLDGREQEGRAVLAQLEVEHPEYAPAHDYLAQIDLAEKDVQGFMTEEARFVASTPDPLQHALLIAAQRGYATGGYDGMLAAMEGTAEHPPDSLPRNIYLQARFAALRGDKTGAMHMLEAAYREHRSGISFLSSDWALRSLRDQSEFAAMANFQLPKPDAHSSVANPEIAVLRKISAKQK